VVTLLIVISAADLDGGGHRGKASLLVDCGNNGIEF